MKKWYELLFENYGKTYDKECFVQGTLGECDFIEQELAYDKSLKIIDIGCGTGRHSIELTKRGYLVTGIDLSDSQLARAGVKEKGNFIFTTLNGLFPLFHSVKEFYESAAQEGNSACKNCSFDLMTFRDHNTVAFEDDAGNKKELECNERYYVPSEITWLLKTLGYKKIDILGAKLGAFSREDKLTAEDFEMLVVAEK